MCIHVFVVPIVVHVRRCNNPQMRGMRAKAPLLFLLLLLLLVMCVFAYSPPRYKHPTLSSTDKQRESCCTSKQARQTKQKGLKVLFTQPIVAGCVYV